jgi:uncharacterized protein (UPF0147 family)
MISAFCSPTTKRKIMREARASHEMPQQSARQPLEISADSVSASYSSPRSNRSRKDFPSAQLARSKFERQLQGITLKSVAAQEILDESPNSRTLPTRSRSTIQELISMYNELEKEED